MIARSDLHQLIDSLPEHELVVAGRFLQELHQRGVDPMLAWAPTDDEPTTPEGDAEADAAWAEYVRGEAVSAEEARRRLLA